MKRAAILMVTMIISMASSQSWNASDGKLNLIGCYGKQNGIYCDFNYTLIDKQTETLYWKMSEFKVFKLDGTSQVADAVSFAGGPFITEAYQITEGKEVIANTPVKLQIYFNLPNTNTVFRALEFDGVKVDNVPVRPYGTVSTTPTQLPVTSPVKGFSISLSNCQLQGQDYVCTATLTPTK